MSVSEDMRAADIIWTQMGKRPDAKSVAKLRAAIAQALREARAEVTVYSGCSCCKCSCAECVNCGHDGQENQDDKS